MIHLTPKELQERLRLKSHRTLANWRVQGRGPKWIKVGSRVRYPVVEVERYEQSLLQRKGEQV